MLNSTNLWEQAQIKPIATQPKHENDNDNKNEINNQKETVKNPTDSKSTKK